MSAAGPLSLSLPWGRAPRPERRELPGRRTAATACARSRRLGFGLRGAVGLLRRGRLSALRRVGLAALRRAVAVGATGGLGLLRRVLLGRRLRRRPAVVAVEAGALEGHADVPEHLPERAAAVGALAQRIVGERLNDLEVLAAVLAAVLVG